MKQPKPITMDEIFAEMEKFRTSVRGVALTDDQKEFLRRGRTGKKLVTYRDLSRLWEKAGWGKITDEGVRSHYRYLTNRERK